MTEHNHPGDGTVPGAAGEPILTPHLGCPACHENMERGHAPASGQLLICRHCGYFLDYEIPKAPDEPGWRHSQYRPDAPPRGVTGPCERPEPEGWK